MKSLAQVWPNPRHDDEGVAVAERFLRFALDLLVHSENDGAEAISVRYTSVAVGGFGLRASVLLGTRMVRWRVDMLVVEKIAVDLISKLAWEREVRARLCSGLLG